MNAYLYAMQKELEEHAGLHMRFSYRDFARCLRLQERVWKCQQHSLTADTTEFTIISLEIHITH